MSNVATTLREKAADLRMTPESVAIGMLKEAGLSEEEARIQVAQTLMEKEAFTTLTNRGIDMEEAVKMVKAANINVRELANFKIEPEVNPEADLMDKAAAYIEALESQIEAMTIEQARLYDDLEKMASEATVQEPALPEAISKLASSAAFTNEDLAALKSMNPDTLTKVASVIGEPWGLGAPSGVAHVETDPLLDFILGGR